MKRIPPALALITSGFLLTGCGASSTSTNTTSNNIALSIPFNAVAGEQKIVCGEYIKGLGEAGSDVKIADFRMFIHDVKLITDQGIKLEVKLDANQPSQNADVVLLDFRDSAEATTICPENNTEDTGKNPNYNNRIKGSATIDPAYNISHIEFTVGVPFELNHRDQTNATEPLRNPGLATGMHWNWQGGYKFTAIDVLPSGDITRPTDSTWFSNKWNIHIGSTGCPTAKPELASGASAEECNAPNRTTITLSLNNTRLNNMAIQLDYAALISSHNLSLDRGVKTGCMSFTGDPECADIFKKFGLPWDNNTSVEQTIFSVTQATNE